MMVVDSFLAKTNERIRMPYMKPLYWKWMWSTISRPALAVTRRKAVLRWGSPQRRVAYQAAPSRTPSVTITLPRCSAAQLCLFILGQKHGTPAVPAIVGSMVHLGLKTTTVVWEMLHMAFVALDMLTKHAAPLHTWNKTVAGLAYLRLLTSSIAWSAKRATCASKYSNHAKKGG